REGRVGLFPITGRTVPTASTDLAGARAYELLIDTQTHEERRDLELSIVAAETFLLHVPLDGHPTRPPTMYCLVLRSSTRRVGHTSRRGISVDIHEVGKPPAGILPTTLNWATV